MNKNKIKILITGGAGYIGSMLSTKLVFLGYEVSVLDSLVYSKSSLNHLHIYKNFKLIHGDVRDKKLIKKIIKKFDFIIPLAALVGAPLCAKHKKLAIDINLNSIQFNDFKNIFIPNNTQDRHVKYFEYFSLPFDPEYSKIQLKDGSPIWNRYSLHTGILDVFGYALNLSWTNFPIKGSFLPFTHYLVYSNSVNSQNIFIDTDVGQ